MSWSQSYVSHCRVLPPGEFNSMSSQSHVSHCRALPLGEFTVTTPEPHATLQGAVTWRNQRHDSATLQGVRIPSAILKIVFPHIFFLFLMQFRLWRAATFVSSPIHLLHRAIFYFTGRRASSAVRLTVIQIHHWRMWAIKIGSVTSMTYDPL